MYYLSKCKWQTRENKTKYSDKLALIKMEGLLSVFKHWLLNKFNIESKKNLMQLIAIISI